MAKPTHRSGSPALFLGAGFLVSAPTLWLVWVGEVQAWDALNNAWQALIGIGLVFILQRSQDRDTHAIQLKLDSLVVAVPEAPSDLAGVELL